MESDDSLHDDCAKPDELRQAIEALTKEDAVRLKKAANYCLFGTEYKDPLELLNEVVVRTMNAAHGGVGRTWKKSIPFMAFMMMTIKGLANDSRDSLLQTMTDHIEAIAVEGGSADDVLGVMGHKNPCVVEQAIEIEECETQRERAKADADAIDTYFVNDDDVNWIIMGHKDGQSASEIREISGMSDTQYATARKRFRRGLEKLFPGRSKP